MARANITKFAIDANRYKFLGANEKVTQKYGWDKENNKRQEHQAIDERTKNPIWVVNVQIVDEQDRLTDTATVTVSSSIEPRIGFMAEVSFENLQLLAMSRKEEFGVSYNFTATGIKPPPAPAASKKAA